MVNCSGLVLFLLALFAAPFSFAAGIGDLFDRHGFAIQPGSGTLNAVSTNASINATAPNGSRAVVPVSAAVHVPKSTLVKNAVRVARAGSAIGVGFLAWDTYNLIKDSGLATCPPPDFFCKPPPVVEDKVSSSYMWRASYSPTNYTSPDDACTKPVFATFGEGAVGILGSKVSETWYQCTIWKNGSGSTYQVNRYDCQYPLTNGQCVPPNQEATIPLTDAEFETKLTEKVDASPAPTPGMPDSGWDSSMYKKLWKAVESDAKLRASQVPQGVITLDGRLGSGSMAYITGPSVVLPETTTKTRLITNPDGSTSTETTKEKTTFTPSQTGTTVADTVPGAKSSTVVTTTTINNTTNQTTTNVETQTPVAPATDAEKEAASDFCKQYPEVLACKMMGAPIEATPVPNENKPVSIVADSGWGASNGACPAPGSITVMGSTIPVPWDVFCQFAQGIRPFLLAFAYMAAVAGFIGLSRGN